MSIATQAAPGRPVELSTSRINLMRAAYLLVAGGLVLVKWPQLPAAHTLPLYEGVTLSMLTAMSLLALLGLLHPVRLLPVLLFETTWKVIWLGLVALPKATSGHLDAATADVVATCSLVVLVAAAVPWGYAWRTYVSRRGNRFA